MLVSWLAVSVASAGPAKPLSAVPKPGATAATTAPCPCKPMRLTAAIKPPVLKSKIDVGIPSGGMNRRFDGGVFIYDVTVARDGSVCDVSVLRTPKIDPPWPQLIERHKQAIKKWAYEPATKKGEPMCVNVTFLIRPEFR